ncbi:PREDICTED: uncharacterized protein LOC108445046 [Corvus brachyrhynchos]|uniref:uncharacterized protein LOC108445046 n=1 Tax=Corvus brachyrhynchos TaxID=85066 RepID=UPI0008164ECA|nr:PREDICTED: uncharacterized protein LOC108445046 [Corvus brachyrhynchos]
MYDKNTRTECEGELILEIQARYFVLVPMRIPANKCFTATLSCLLLIIMFVYKLQAVRGRNNYFSLVWSLASLITASTTLPEQTAFPALHEPRDFGPCFSGWWGSPSSAGSSSLAGPAELRARRAGRARQPRLPPGPPQPGQRRAVTSRARPRPPSAPQFTETLLALKLIIDQSLSIFEQGLYLRGSRFSHAVCNCFELLSHCPWIFHC